MAPVSATISSNALPVIATKPTPVPKTSTIRASAVKTAATGTPSGAGTLSSRRVSARSSVRSPGIAGASGVAA